MKIDVASLETPELLLLIAAASGELQKRVIAGTVAIERRPAAEPAVIVVNEPSKTDQAVAMRILSLLHKNGYVLADERREYKQIIASYPEWAREKRLPEDVAGSAYRRWSRLHGP